MKDGFVKYLQAQLRSLTKDTLTTHNCSMSCTWFCLTIMKKVKEISSKDKLTALVSMQILNEMQRVGMLEKRVWA